MSPARDFTEFPDQARKAFEAFGAGDSTFACPDGLMVRG